MAKEAERNGNGKRLWVTIVISATVLALTIGGLVFSAGTQHRDIQTAIATNTKQDDCIENLRTRDDNLQQQVSLLDASGKVTQTKLDAIDRNVQEIKALLKESRRP